MSFLLDAASVDRRPIAVLGTGTLGRRIALMYATRGGDVRLYDTGAAAAAQGADWASAQLGDVVATIDEGGLVPVEVIATGFREAIGLAIDEARWRSSAIWVAISGGSTLRCW